MKQSRPITTIIPLSSADIHFGRLRSMASLARTVPGFNALELPVIEDVIASGFGYPSANAIFLTDPTSFKLTHMPERELSLFDLVAWRMAKTGHVSIADAAYAIKYIWQRCHLVVTSSYSWIGLRIDLNSTSSDYTDTPTFLKEIFENIPPYKKALNHHGKLFLLNRVENAIAITQQYWSEECGIKSTKIANDIKESGWIDLSDALTTYGVSAMPPGLDARSFYDMCGRLVGHGFYSTEIDGYLTQIYPSNAVMFIDACIALWHHRPVPLFTRKDLPETIFADEYANPFILEKIKREYPVEVTIEMADVEPIDRDAIPIIDGQIDLGYNFDFEGVTYTRPLRKFVESNFEGVLGLHLISAKEVPDDYCAWMQEKIPFAVSESTCDLLFRLDITLEQLRDEELKWLEDEANDATVKALAIVTSTYATPLPAASSETQMQGNRGWVKMVDIPDAGKTIPTVYPQLSALPIDVMGEYALDFWGKNGIRHDKTHTIEDRKFLLYATLRNLGCDPFSTLGRYNDLWLSLFRLVRLSIEAIPPPAQNADAYKTIGDSARILSHRFCDLLELYDALDTSMNSTRLHRLDIPESYVDCTNAI